MKIRTTGATERTGDVPDELARELIRQGLAVRDGSGDGKPAERPKTRRRRAPHKKTQADAPASSA